MKHSNETRQPKCGWRRVIAILLALSLLLIPVNFPSAANAVEANTITDEFTDPWGQGHTWKLNNYASNSRYANVKEEAGKLIISNVSSKKHVFAYITSVSGGADVAAMTDYTLTTTFSREKNQGQEDTAAPAYANIYFRLQMKEGGGYTGYYLSITNGAYDGSGNGTAIVRKLNGDDDANGTNMIPVGATGASFSIKNPASGDCTISVKLEGNSFTLSYTDISGNPATKTYTDEAAVEDSPYLSGSVAVGCGSKAGTVKFNDLQLSLPQQEPPVNLPNEFTDEFTADLSTVRNPSPWPQGYTWAMNNYAQNANYANLEVKNGKLVISNLSTKKHVFAYVTSVGEGGSDAAAAMTDYTLTTTFSREKNQGQEDTATPAYANIYFRLQMKEGGGYTGYYLSITNGAYDGSGNGTAIVRKLNGDNDANGTNMIPVGATGASFSIKNPASGDCTISVKLEGNSFTLSYTDISGNPATKTYTDEAAVEDSPYLSGSVAVGCGSKAGTVKYESVKVSMPADASDPTNPPVNPPVELTNEFTDEFTADLSTARTPSPWERGYTWGLNAKEGDVTVADGKLVIARGSGSKNPTFAYVKALDSTGTIDYATQMSDYTMEVKFSRTIAEGAEEGDSLINPRIFFRLQNTDLGYTGYYLKITGVCGSDTGVLSLSKMIPIPNSTNNYVLMQPTWGVTVALGEEYTIKVVAKGNVFEIYFDSELKGTFTDENVGDVAPYLTGTVGVGGAAAEGTVKVESVQVTLAESIPPLEDLSDNFTDEFTSDLSVNRDISPWEQGYTWGANAKDGDLTVVNGQLLVNFGSGSKKPSFAYITAPDANGNDAATEMEDYEFEVQFSRFAPDGVTEGSAITPRIYFRLTNTAQGYTGYYLTITGTNEKGDGILSLNKMTPTVDNANGYTLMKPYWSVAGRMGSTHTIKVVAEGNVFEIYYDGELKGTFVDENIGGVDPYLTGTFAMGASTAYGTVKYDYAKISLIKKTEEEQKFKKYAFTGSIDKFADRWEMDAALGIADQQLVNTGNAAAMGVLKNNQILADYMVDTDITLPEDGVVSVLGRYTENGDKFYELTLEKGVGLVLSKTVGGVKTVLKTASAAELYLKDIRVLSSASYNLKLQMYGSTVEGWINDQMVLSYEDAEAISSGVGGLILDPGAKAEYLKIDKINALISVAVMNDTNKNGNDHKLSEYLVEFNEVIEVPVGKTPDIKNLYIKAEFYNGTVQYIPLDTIWNGDFEVNTLGDKSITVIYLNATADVKYRVIDRTAVITELVQNISALNVSALTITDKDAVYALEDIYSDLTVAEKATIPAVAKEKLTNACQTIEFLIYPELAGSQIVFEEHFDSEDDIKKYNTQTSFTGDRHVGYWTIENGMLVQYATDDSVRTSTLLTSARLENQNFQITSISVDVQIIDRNVWVGLDFNANVGDRYRFYICDKTDQYNSATRLYGNRLDFNKNGTRLIREWKYEDFWQPGEWINLRVTYVGGVIRCYVDDVLWIEYTDSTNPLTSGTIGLVSAEGWTRFDNLVVRGIELDVQDSGNKYNTELEPGEYTDKFNDEIAGNSPSHWIEDNKEDNWKVRLDGTDLVYGNANSLKDDYSHSWLHVFDQDVDYTAKVKVTEIGDYPLVGLTARYNYEESYIKAGYDFTREQWFIKVRYGFDFEEIVVYSAADAPKMEVGTWYDLRLSVVGKKLELYVDGSATPVVVADAGRKVMTGRVGVYTERCNVVIDDVELILVSGQSHVQDGVLEYTVDYDENVDYHVYNPKFKFPTIMELSDGRYLMVHGSDRMISNDKGQTFVETTEFDNTDIGESHIMLHDGTYLSVYKEKVYRSVDECRTWVRLNDLPLDSNYGYAHTGDRLCEIKLADGTYRIFVTIDAKYNDVVAAAQRTTIAQIYYSDDGGESWTVSQNSAVEITNLIRYAETNIIRAKDGTLIQYCSYNPSDCVRYNISYDNGVTWEGDYALPQIPGGVVSFCVEEDPYNPGEYYMSTVYNFAVSYNNGFPRHRISLFKSTDGYNWEFLCDVDRWGDVSDGGRRDIMQSINMYLSFTEDYVFASFARAERAAEKAHHINFGRIYRFDRTKLEVQAFPQEYIIDGKCITYIEGVEEQITLNSDYSAKNFIVHYYDGTSENISLSEATVSGVDTSVEGKQTVVVDYENFRAVYEIEIVKGTAPTVGAENDKIYCVEKEIVVGDTDGDLESVTLNGVAVTLVNGKFTVSAKEGVQTIIATDKAGNVTTVKITVNVTHTGGEATCTDKAKCEVCGESYGEKNADKHTKDAKWTITGEKHSEAYECCGKVVVAEGAHTGGSATCEDKAVCSVCNTAYGELAAHKGGEATCTDKAKCDVCGEAYGELNADKHTKDAKWTITGEKHSKVYECCGKVVVAEEAHEWKDGKCEECGYEAAPGTAEKPIEIPADKDTVKTEAKVEAGSEQYFELDEKLAGKTITIKGEGAYAIIDGKKYEAVNGVLEVKLPAKTGKISMIIGNAGTKAGTFSITVATPSEDNSDTGDNTAIVLFGSLMALSIMATAVLLIPNIRKKLMNK